eukprot:jgi/Picsp_1/3911/NSC_01423-R1_s-adenosyl-l-methionine-dependent methyltransferase domain-containing protein
MDAVKGDRLPESIIDHFFKNRHWFSDEFPMLKEADTIFEIGCGTGSSIYPLLELNRKGHVYACDFSRSAIELVKQNPLYNATGRVTAFVADIVNDPINTYVSNESIDIGLMVFVLSAVSPEKQLTALRKISATLPSGGWVLFRDYCEGDLAQKRLQVEGKQQKISDSFYARGDGTRAYYFSEEGIKKLFSEAGFDTESLEIIQRSEMNRRSMVVRDRKYIQGIFRKKQTTRCMGIRTAVLNNGGGREIGTSGYEKSHKDGTNLCPFNSKENLELKHLVLGRLKVLVPTTLSSVEVCMAEFVVRNPDLFLSNHAIEIAATCSCTISLATLNWTSLTIAVPSRSHSEAMKHIVCRNSDRFLYERLRILQADTLEHRGIQVFAQNLHRKNARGQPRRTIVLLPILEQRQVDSHISLAIKVLQAATGVSILILACPYEVLLHIGEEQLNQLNVGLPDHDSGHAYANSLHLTKLLDVYPAEVYSLEATDKPNTCFVLAHMRN